MNLDITPVELVEKLDKLIKEFYHNVNAYGTLDKIEVHYLEHDPADPFITYTVAYGIDKEFHNTVEVSPFDVKNIDLTLGQIIQLITLVDAGEYAQ